MEDAWGMHGGRGRCVRREGDERVGEARGADFGSEGLVEIL